MSNDIFSEMGKWLTRPCILQMDMGFHIGYELSMDVLIREDANTAAQN